MINGTIVKGIGGFYYVNTPDGVIECKARGRFRRLGIKPCVGDHVKITVQNGQGAVEEILPRHNLLIRPPVANIDQIVIVIAAAMPQPDTFMVDKLTVMAEQNNIGVVICINKIDLAAPDKLIDIYNKAGYPVIALSALEDGEGIKPYLNNKITAFAGNSGVGKSSLLNALGFQLETGEISRIEHGKHTTRHVELMPFGDNGFVIDTPGFSLLDVAEMPAGDLYKYFFEMKDINCGFLDCAHIGAKGCGVIQAVEQGNIAPSRYESYTQLYNTLKDYREWQKK